MSKIFGEVVSVHKTGVYAFVDGEQHFCLVRCAEKVAVNDKVVLQKREDRFVIVGIEPRKNFVARYDHFKKQQQIFAANIDTVFIVTSANREFSLRRIERFAKIAEGIRTVVVVTKSDLSDKVYQSGLEQVCINALDPVDVKKLCWSGTALLVGSSGVGKTTIINTLLGVGLKTREVKGDKFLNKGKHTTSARTMYYLEDGRKIIDVPGVRIVGVEEGEHILRPKYRQ